MNITHHTYIRDKDGSTIIVMRGEPDCVGQTLPQPWILCPVIKQHPNGKLDIQRDMQLCDPYAVSSANDYSVLTLGSSGPIAVRNAFRFNGALHTNPPRHHFGPEEPQGASLPILHDLPYYNRLAWAACAQYVSHFTQQNNTENPLGTLLRHLALDRRACPRRTTDLQIIENALKASRTLTTTERDDAIQLFPHWLLQFSEERHLKPTLPSNAVFASADTQHRMPS